MGREVSQHGMVRPSPKPTNFVNSSVDAKVFSKYTTGTYRKVRCTECHSHPVTESRGKAKGRYKASQNHQLSSWGVMDSRHLNDFKGLSAAAVLGRLSDDYLNEGGNEETECDDGGTFVDEIADELGMSVTEMLCFLSDEYVNEDEGGDGEETGCYNDGCKFVDDLVIGSSGVVERGESCILDGEMDFYQVGFIVEDLDGEGWCVVSEM